MKRTWAVGIAVAGVSALSAGIAFANVDNEAGDSTGKDESCDYQELSGDPGQAGAISPNGEYIVGFSDEGATLWHNGEASPIKGLDEFDNLDFNAVTDSGEVIGSGYVHTEGSATGWMYDGESITELTAPDELDPPEDAWVVPADINAEGQIAGYVAVGGGGNNPFPLKWEAGETVGTPLDLGTMDNITAEHIAPDGTVLGTVIEDPNEPAPYVWNPEGEGAEADLPGDFEAIAGDQVLLSGDYVWTVGSQEEPRQVEGLYDANGIDAQGRVYGTLGDADDPVPGYVDEDGQVELPSGEKDPDKYSEYDEAVAASEDGSVILGNHTWGEDEEQELSAVVWNCG